MHAASSNGSSGITRPNMEVGWTWPNLNWGVLSSQCLDQRIPDQLVLKQEVEAWEADRNEKHTKAEWQFNTANARVKLKRLYPAL
jgi:hypothetical protein